MAAPTPISPVTPVMLKRQALPCQAWPCLAPALPSPPLLTPPPPPVFFQMRVINAFKSTLEDLQERRSVRSLHSLRSSRSSHPLSDFKYIDEDPSASAASAKTPSPHSSNHTGTLAPAAEDQVPHLERPEGSVYPHQPHQAPAAKQQHQHHQQQQLVAPSAPTSHHTETSI